MPLKTGKGTMAGNMHELRHGKQFARTAKKFGKKKALKQAVAIALAEERMPKKDRRGFY